MFTADHRTSYGRSSIRATVLHPEVTFRCTMNVYEAHGCRFSIKLNRLIFPRKSLAHKHSLLRLFDRSIWSTANPASRKPTWHVSMHEPRADIDRINNTGSGHQFHAVLRCTCTMSRPSSNRLKRARNPHKPYIFVLREWIRVDWDQCRPSSVTFGRTHPKNENDHKMWFSRMSFCVTELSK